MFRTAQLEFLPLLLFFSFLFLSVCYAALPSSFKQPDDLFPTCLMWICFNIALLSRIPTQWAFIKSVITNRAIQHKYPKVWTAYFRIWTWVPPQCMKCLSFLHRPLHKNPNGVSGLPARPVSCHTLVVFRTIKSRWRWGVDGAESMCCHFESVLYVMVNVYLQRRSIRIRSGPHAAYCAAFVWSWKQELSKLRNKWRKKMQIHHQATVSLTMLPWQPERGSTVPRWTWRCNTKLICRVGSFVVCTSLLLSKKHGFAVRGFVCVCLFV